MPTIQFEGMSVAQSVVETAKKFTITGNFILADEGQIARYHNNFWEHKDGGHYVSYKTDGPCWFYFEDFGGRRSPIFGPMALFVNDGTIRAESQFIARLSEASQIWHCQIDNTYWATLYLVD